MIEVKVDLFTIRIFFCIDLSKCFDFRVKLIFFSKFCLKIFMFEVKFDLFSIRIPIYRFVGDITKSI